VNKFFGVELTPPELPAFMADETHKKELFDAFFRGYTSKQWGRPPEEIDPTIIQRVPVRSTYDVNYFNDYNQGIPISGYNSLFDRLLDHPNITVECGHEFSLEEHRSSALSGVPVCYSGPIDRLFGYCYGELPWRSLAFEQEKLDMVDFQGTSVVNYTEAEVPYTRIHEFKHYHPEDKAIMACGKTIIMREYPRAWKSGDEPYYPVNNPESQALLEKYQAEASKVKGLIIGGRLGEYRYYDMDQSISKALEAAKVLTGR
jgi:UDP-galactopyranose mutase